MLAQFVLFDGFDPLDVLGPFEVLDAAKFFTDRFAVELVSAQGAREVPSGCPGVHLTAAARLDPARARIVVVPGAASRIPGPGDEAKYKGHENKEERAAGRGADLIPAILGRALTTELPKLLAEAVASPQTTVAAVCGGSLLLSMSGLLHGRHATTHHQGLDALAAAGARVVPGRVVDDGDLITAGAVTSGMDLGLYLLERAAGPEVALAVERLLGYERRGVVWRGRGDERMLVAAGSEPQR